MTTPTLTQLAKGTAHFTRYENGQLWYDVEYQCADACEVVHCFEFPIPVDHPDMYATAQTVAHDLQVVDYASATVQESVQTLCEAVARAKKSGAGAGQFLASDKAIRFLRWIRPHLEMLNAAKSA